MDKHEWHPFDFFYHHVKGCMEVGNKKGAKSWIERALGEMDSDVQVQEDSLLLLPNGIVEFVDSKDAMSGLDGEAI